MRSRPSIAGLLLACVFAVASCGDDGGGNETPSPPPEPTRDEFPDPAGRTLAELRKTLPEGGPVLAPSVSQFHMGKNRLGFGLFTAARAQIADAKAVVYVAPVGGGEARGPYLATFESLAVRAPFQSETTTSDPDAAKSLYVATVPFDKPGRYEILGMARLDDRLVAATSATPQITVVREDIVPGPGDKAPVVHTPTVAEVGGDIASIDTRVPPLPEMHEVDFADVVGREPVVLTFATPLLCQSRVCGPVVDIAAQLQEEYGDRAKFIHMEIYRDNEVSKGFRPQVAAWNLPTEPWVFTIDREGRIAARLEGAFSAAELEAAIEKALKE